MGWNTQAVIAQLVIIEGPNDGLFVYNGTPAAGNLIGSISASGGTDQFGNATLPQIAAYSPSTGQAVVFVTAAIAYYIGPVGGAGPWTETFAMASSASPGTLTLLQNFVANGNIRLRPGAGGQVQIGTAFGTSALLEVQSTIGAARLDAIPAGVAPPARPSGTEPWNTLTSLTYQNSWADSGTNIPGRYRFTAGPPATVEIEGDLTVGTVADGTLIVTLPSAYFPTHSQIIRVVVPAGTPTNPGNMRLTVGTDGTIKCTSLAGLASPNRIYFHDFISLD